MTDDDEVSDAGRRQFRVGNGYTMALRAMRVSLPAALVAASVLASRLAGGDAASAPVADLERGHRLYLAGDYAAALRALDGLAGRLPRNADYALYFAGESAFYSGEPARARALFEALARQRSSRFAAVASWRIADCLWAEGRHPDAV